MRTCFLWAALVLPVVWPGTASAQRLPEGPIGASDGRFALGGEVVATAGTSDEGAYFNYTDYEQYAHRSIRAALSAVWRPGGGVAVVGELRSDNLDGVRAHAAYVRVRPWRDRGFAVQAGRIPPVFGRYGRRVYDGSATLIGMPLAYQYLTSLRPDAVPAAPGQLLAMRGRGWRPSYATGSASTRPGVPLVSGLRWDTGIEASWEGNRVDGSAAWTAGTLSDPRTRDNNGRGQLAGRIGYRPVPGLILGLSAARGEWLAADVSDLLRAGRGHTQTALGLDGEYSRDYWLVRGELVLSEWAIPVPPGARERLWGRSGWIEGQYRLTPRTTVAARLDTLRFSAVRPAGASPPRPWDAPVARGELGLTYALQRNLDARVSLQANHRDGGRVRRRTYVAGQLAYWF